MHIESQLRSFHSRDIFNNYTQVVLTSIKGKKKINVIKMSKNFPINYILIIIIFFNCAWGVIKKSSRLELLDNCGGEYSGYEYTIVSPNYPNNYSENDDCIYILRGNSQSKCNQSFHLNFLNFTLRHSYECQKDYLEIDDRVIFCGNIVGTREFLSKNNTLKLRFHSDKNGSEKGFKILVTTLPCSNLLELKNEDNKNDCNKKIHNYQSDSITKLSKSIVNKDSEFINYKNIYPVYRPENEQLPSISNINQSNNNNNNNNIRKELNHHFQLSTYDKQSYHNETSPLKFSTYFFSSPNTDNYTLNSHLKRSEFNNKHNKNNIEIVVAEPSSKLLLPSYHHTVFNNNSMELITQSDINKSNSRKFGNFNGSSISRNNEKLIYPPRPNNVLPGVPYAPLPGFETQIKTGEVLDNVGENNNCNGKINIDAPLQVSGYTRDGQIPGNNYLPSVFARKPYTYPATTYGAPGGDYPPTIESIPNIPADNIIVDPKLIISNQNNYPILPINPQPVGFIPSQNVGNIFPNILPNYNPKIHQCCRNNYDTQRFLLASPGFSSLFYVGNSYECTYTIFPSSIDVCRIRFNLKYFNHGIDDGYCTRGYIKIDGQRYCGCKTGLTIIRNVINSMPKIINVNYLGYPHSKFNGFLIEIVQENCWYSNYPNLSRNKKAINNTIINNENKNIKQLLNRTRRELGYSYPKPHVPFNPIGGEFLNSGGITTQSRCQRLNFIDWTLAAKQIHLRRAKCIINSGNGGLIPNTPGGSSNILPNYPQSGSGPEIIYPSLTLPQSPSNPSYIDSIQLLGNCQVISVAEGIISSPGYPNTYPNNINLCYRFLRIPNGCQLRMSILDFDLENSPGCVKDYLLFSNQNSRYCGRSLTGTKSILEFPRNNIIDVRFFTDSYGTRRGFNIGFVQVLCKVV